MSRSRRSGRCRQKHDGEEGDSFMSMYLSSPVENVAMVDGEWSSF